MSLTLELARSFLGKTVHVIIDRPLGSIHPREIDLTYEVNYGYVPNVLAPDGAELDAYVLGIKEPLETFTGVCIAIVHRQDDDDDKLVVVPEGKHLSNKDILNAIHFQEQFFTSVIVRE
ncbi:MAG: inorganic diphosphatase [Trueperaceae bacterium]